MNRRRLLIVVVVLTLLLPAVFVQAKGPGGGGKPNPSEGAGNNLSYPVIWAEGIPKVLRGVQGVVNLGGEYWYQWGTNGSDPDVTAASCLAEQDESLVPSGMYLCDDSADGVPNGTYDEDLAAGMPPADNPLSLVKAFIQKDELSDWQAWSGTPAEAGVAGEDGRIEIDWIDWGDNLESVDWTMRSQVRTEVVLFQDNPTPEIPWLEYEMRHTSGWGINEVHGLAAELATTAPLLGPGERSTVYSHCARLTIQKLLVDRDDPALANLAWVQGEGWVGEGLISPHMFNGSVHEGGDGPGYYSAEINVKGRIIYGYTWNVRNLNEGPGDYRLTFSFDEQCGTVLLNTYFGEGTMIMLPIEEEVTEPDAEPGAGGTAVLDLLNNLTYMDITIVEKSGGGGRR